MDDLKEFCSENRSYVINFVLLAIVCIAGIWLVYDHYRNEPIYHDTDANLEQLEKRIDRIESRIDTLSARLEQAKETAAELGGRIESSTGLAKEIGAGIGTVETRLDSAIQRSGRIKNIIADIEAKNK